MPRNDGEVRNLHDLPIDDRLAAGGAHQLHWYSHISFGLWGCRSVIDVGAGTGLGSAFLKAAYDVRSIDIAPAGPAVERVFIDDVADDSCDLAVAVDVIEHVEDDAAFLAHLRRVARRRVFITTPNWNVSRCRNPYHIREYTPAELRELVGDPIAVWVSGPQNAIDRRAGIDDGETWNNFGVLLSV